MRLEFGSLVLDNFKAFSGVHVFDMREFDDGLHFLRGRNEVEPRLGSNGAGKSSLWDALTWCLFGKTGSGLRNTDVRPWGGKGSTRVSIGVSVNKEKHNISRSIAPNHIAIDRRECGQEDVEKLIGLDFDLFTNTVLLGQGRPLFFDLQPREKMQLFVNALQLDRWDRRAHRASDRVGTLTTTITELEGKASGLHTALTELDTLIKQTKIKADSWEREQNDLMKEANAALVVMGKEAIRIRNVRDKADLALEGAETEWRHYRKQLVKNEEALLDADRVFQKVESIYEAHNDTIYALQNDLKQMGEGDICKSCGQRLEGTAFAKHRATVKSQLASTLKDTSLEKEATKLQAKTKACEDAVKKTRTAVLEYHGKVNNARDNLESYGKELSDIDAKLKSLRAATKDREAEVNPHTQSMRDIRKRRLSLETKMQDADADAAAARRKAARAKFWIKGFKDVRLYVLEDVLRELEMETNAMLDEAGLVNWRVSYTVERETARGNVSRGLNIMIRSPRSHGEVKWESWSGGEGQRLRIVGALALSEVLLNHAGVVTNMEALDEPTQHLSGEGVVDLCEYLSDRARRLRKSIFYIDHASIESTRFATVTTIIRDKRGARIEATA